MTQQAEILNKFEQILPKLSPQKFGEVIDFMGYLERNTEQDLEPKPAPIENNGKIRLTLEQIDEMVKNCESLRSLTGILKTDMSLDEIRMKRLAKHL